ncbi:MAG: TonB-dependent receptor [Gammaproteobacteria bacterium]|nr:TonB-dependent receptor [Gammaproteobacteria bacterium]
MSLKSQLSLLSLSISLCLSQQLHAQEQIDFFDMSIEQLINVETQVASIRSESIKDTPSVVTTFSQAEIRSLGVSELFDLMNFVPGFQSVTGEFVSSHKKLQSRGVYLDSGYVLIMVDGVRLNESSFGKASVYTPYIDLTNVEKVEVIRGPGSEIYGSNAYLGVVNVVTKKSNDSMLEIGSHNHEKFTANLHKKYEFGDLAINLALIEGDGETYPQSLLNIDDVSSSYKNNKPYKHQQFSVSFGNDVYSLQYKIDGHELDRFVNLEGYHPDNRFDALNQYFSGSFNHEFANKINWQTLVNYSQHEMKSAGYIQSGDIRPYSQDFILGPRWSTRDKNVRTQLSYDIQQNMSMKAGIEWLESEHYEAGALTTHLTPDSSSTIPLDNYYLGGVTEFTSIGDYQALENTIESVALYGQFKWQVDQTRTLNLGGRYEKYQELDDRFTPRISYIQKLNEQNQFKLIYSEAYRAPVTNELYSDDGVTLGNPNLKAEQVSTIEAQYLYKQVNWSAEITGFHNSMDDLIISKPIGNTGRTQFQNGGSETISGIEALGYYRVNQHVKLRGTVTSYLTSTVESSYSHFATLALLSEYQDIQVGVNTIYRPKVEVTDGFRLASQQQVFSEDDLFLVNANITYNLGRSISLTLNATNLFDENYDIYEPRQNLNNYKVPQQGRMVKFSVGYRF